MEDKFIEVEGVKIRYKIHEGEKKEPIIVFLHGYSFTADTWDEIGTLKFFRDHNISFVALDMPGFGKSKGKRIRDGFRGAEFLKKFLEKMGIKNIVLVGPSMGGRYVLSYAIRYPEDLVGLVLIAPAGLKEEDIASNLPNINTPTLIFWGDKDTIFPVGVGYELKEKIPNSKLVVCKDAPHPCYLKATDLFNKELLNFIKEL